MVIKRVKLHLRKGRPVRGYIARKKDPYKGVSESWKNRLNKKFEKLRFISEKLTRDDEYNDGNIPYLQREQNRTIRQILKQTQGGYKGSIVHPHIEKRIVRTIKEGYGDFEPYGGIKFKRRRRF